MEAFIFLQMSPQFYMTKEKKQCPSVLLVDVVNEVLDLGVMFMSCIITTLL